VVKKAVAEMREGIDNIIKDKGKLEYRDLADQVSEVVNKYSLSDKDVIKGSYFNNNVLDIEKLIESKE